ncbi:efflux transporter, RND family, MFP subunit [Burkholderia ambifaria AMMD]|uniref:Secretion protein HlyD family protein n=1 Tax=Burkholderia ambifaria (strain ATCC BAA-244 / DSM 16087 / CCUG 44356 / LMG 19182 / AMMD) TaxID=339670 RepID=Q0B720_BURCM|nr:HlyD family efflux transporter periplasmic adaptor subunit [Burkholderia ambifaria]ABI90053.1 secretion protein HlyD family protein [Burkholderia ambifaria AMMD]AJY25487.1 efflux transporter, RND family, MFP subunit [Burkholderia ambifaria AMMD]MBR7930594.1 efflux RND transporter periplasmic adaptor subunit [Burkholderia ambifaria]PEH68131.1 hemolysin secretion protein D [Burkholderia ambifaria]QQC07315.1 efflux RND transporter periplasmic adaptor subunit [Burkholderia ambifaria]
MHHDNLHTAAQPAALNDPALDARRATRRKRFTLFFAVVLLAALVWIAFWLLHDRYVEDTDDAYVAGSIVQVAAQIPGAVTDVLVADTQPVRAGQPLVRLDDTEASVAFAQAKAQLVQAVRQVANAKISNTMYVEAVNARQADLSLAQRALAARSGASVEIVAPEELARAHAAVAGAQANLAAAQAQLEAARALGSKLPVDESPAVVQAAAQFRLAYRNLKRTTIVAPVDGTVGQRSVQVGQQVGPGVPLMSIVQLNRLWIEANFKEGQIRHMRIGQPVDVVSDLYGSRVVYRGRVQGFSAGTGSAFSMLPSQNAAGNWIKVVQRVPVVIAIDPRDLAAHPLRVGLSMRATVDTRNRDGHALDSEPPTPAVSTRVHDGVASDAQAAATAIIRENQGG